MAELEQIIRDHELARTNVPMPHTAADAAQRTKSMLICRRCYPHLVAPFRDFADYAEHLATEIRTSLTVEAH